MSELSSDVRSWTERIPSTFPDFRSAYDELLAANDGELLPTLAWAEFGNFVSRMVPGPTQWLQEMADFLEDAAVAGPEVANLVQVGLMEQLDENTAHAIMPYLRANTRALLEKSRTY